MLLADKFIHLTIHKLSSMIMKQERKIVDMFIFLSINFNLNENNFFVKIKIFYEFLIMLQPNLISSF